MIITFSVTLGKAKFGHKYKVEFGFNFKLYKSYTCLGIRGAKLSDSFFPLSFERFQTMYFQYHI